MAKDLLKIGKTTRHPEERAKELTSSTGVAAPFYVAYDIKVRDCDKVESLVHHKLSPFRYTSNREFFCISLKKAIDAVQEIASNYPYKGNSTPSISKANPVVNEIEYVNCTKNLYYLIGKLLADIADEESILENSRKYMKGAAYKGHKKAKKLFQQSEYANLRNLGIGKLIRDLAQYEQTKHKELDAEQCYSIGLQLHDQNSPYAILYMRYAALLGHNKADFFMNHKVGNMARYKHMGLLEVSIKAEKYMPVKYKLFGKTIIFDRKIASNDQS